MWSARVTSKTDYATRAVLCLALQECGHVVSIGEISDRAGIPVKFLESILVVLKNAGLLESRRGKEGGYLLARAPEDLTVGDVVCAMEGALAPAEALEPAEVQDPMARAVSGIWLASAQAACAVLSRTTFADLCDRARAEQTKQANAYMYYL